MRYVSIDIETTGIDRDWCDIIEFGAILEDTENQLPYEEIPKFHRYLKPPRQEGYRGEIFALNMHAKNGILEELTELDSLEREVEKKEKEIIRNAGRDTDFEWPEEERRAAYDRLECYISPRKLLHEFSGWLVGNGYENTNKNPSGPLMVNLGCVTVAGKNFFAFDWNYLAPLFGDRICRRAIDPSIWFWNPAEDERVPSTGECLERAGLEPTGEHTALADAWDVIRLVRIGLERSNG
jgi:hypothetical protein